jgi:hypothetical protein
MTLTLQPVLSALHQLSHLLAIVFAIGAVAELAWILRSLTLGGKR